MRTGVGRAKTVEQVVLVMCSVLQILGQEGTSDALSASNQQAQPPAPWSTEQSSGERAQGNLTNPVYF